MLPPAVAVAGGFLLTASESRSTFARLDSRTPTTQKPAIPVAAGSRCARGFFLASNLLCQRVDSRDRGERVTVNDAGRVNYAVRFCLAECCQTGTPLIYLSDFVAFLRQKGWDESALIQIQRQVLNELARAQLGQLAPENTF